MIQRDNYLKKMTDYKDTEFIKVITGQDDEGIKKALKHSLIRIVCAVLLLLLPMLVNFIITVINNAFSGEVTIGANGEVTCGVGK